ncbi:hypothetical protein AB0M36_24300 [Actinoplanes sp. NPDC051346]|uniref:hypothetical protein n=1 Tax=Actinoplanes sp. NPDC051346 TaxID=3155048 RepID=UPI00343199B3
MRDPNWDTADPPSEPHQPLVVELRITEPAAAHRFEGPWNGVTVTLAGTAQVVAGTGSIERVDVRFGDADPVTATGTTSWSASTLWTTAGAVRVTVQAIVAGRVYRERTLDITTALRQRPAGPDKPPPDTDPPSVAVLTPIRDSTLVAADGRVPVSITGTSADAGQGVAAVEVTVDGTPVKVRQVDGSWNRWAADATLAGLGRHVIVARAVDAAQLSQEDTVHVDTVAAAVRPPVMERLFLVEKCRLSILAGAHGRGRPCKVLPLGPGDKVKVVVKSFRRSSESSVASSSILDSHTEESQADFENTLTAEQSNKHAVQENSSWNIEAKIGAQWGFASASVSGGATAATNASREELAKNITTAVQKHAAKASAKREQEVKTTREMKREESEEFSSESQIENINVSRTMNVVFYETLQECHTVLSLVDVRVGYLRGDTVKADDGETVAFTYREATLSQLDGLLRTVLKEEHREEVRRTIVEILANVFDYQDEPHRMVEERTLVDASGAPLPNGSYLRVPRNKISTYVDPATGSQFVVPGVILAAAKTVTRFDGLMCEALLGTGEALDSYSAGLQEEALEARRLDNERQRVALARDQLAVDVVTRTDAAAAAVFTDVYPAPETESLALVTSSAAADPKDVR